MRSVDTRPLRLVGSLVWLLSVATVALSLACAQPEIGDSCEISTDCSVQGDRVCDVSQSAGYCTIRGCDPGGCPDDAVCVEFRGEPERTAERWCMATCDADDCCREDEGYSCIGASEILDEQGQVIAEVLGESASFCSLTSL